MTSRTHCEPESTASHARPKRLGRRQRHSFAKVDESSADGDFYCRIEDAITQNTIAAIDLALLTQASSPSTVATTSPEDNRGNADVATALPTAVASGISAEAASELPTWLREGPVLTSSEETKEMASLSQKEISDAHKDVFGRNHPTEERMEKTMADLSEHLNLMPFEEKAALMKARRAFPLLFYTSSHTKIFLAAEDWEPSRAAARMVRYWEKREKILGDAAFSPGAVNNPDEEDYLRLYNDLLDKFPAETDEEMKHIALGFVRQFHRTKINAMDLELARIPPRKKWALIEAQKSSPRIASADDHKIAFLRSVDFNPRRAAQRLANYWDLRLELFAEDAFGPITLETLEDCERELSLGFVCLLPRVDEHGRALFYFQFEKALEEDFKHETDCHLKAIWYMCHAALDRADVGRSGVVIIHDLQDLSLDLLQGFSRDLFGRIGHIFKDCMPVNLKAVHDCLPPRSWWFQLIKPWIKWALGRKYRARYILHEGTKEEVIALLNECGISADQIPERLGGTCDVENMIRNWLAERRSAGL